MSLYLVLSQVVYSVSECMLVVPICHNIIVTITKMRCINFLIYKKQVPPSYQFWRTRQILTQIHPKVCVCKFTWECACRLATNHMKNTLKHCVVGFRRKHSKILCRHCLHFKWVGLFKALLAGQTTYLFWVGYLRYLYPLQYRVSQTAVP